MGAFIQDLRYAARLLIRMRGVAIVAILTLAVGIGATTTMFSVVYAALLRPVPFAEPDRLAMLYVTRTTPRDGQVRLRWSRPVIDRLQTTRALESIASFSGTNVSVSVAGSVGSSETPEQIDGEIVSPDYFHVLQVTPLAGRTFAPDEDTAAGTRPVVVISERLWRRKFGADPRLLGAPVRVNAVPLTVIGILPAGCGGLTGKADLWLPRTLAPQLTYTDYLTTPQHFISVVARLRPGVTLEQANAELGAAGARFSDAGSKPDTTWGATAWSIGDARIDTALRQSVLVLLSAASCVLLIACVNVASLLLARARTRRREIAVRLAIGAKRGRLVRQLLTEGLLLAAMAGAGGLALAAWGVRLVAQMSPIVSASASFASGGMSAFAVPTLDVRALVFTLAATLGTTIVFGLVPALEASRPQLSSALKEDTRGGGRHRTLDGLVVSEIALAVLLLAAAGLLADSFARLQDLRTGFTTDGVLTFWIRPPNSRYAVTDGPAIVERLLTRIEQVPGVDMAAVNRCTPFTGCARSNVFFPDRSVDPLAAPTVGRHYISADYFRTLGMALRAGRVLTAEDRAGRAPVAVVNETGARRFWPGENPIGKRVWFGPTTGPAFADPARPVEVVGVVGDVKYESADQITSDRADFYTSYLQFAYPDTLVIVKARGSATALIPSLRAAVASVDSALPIFDIQTLDERIGGALWRPRFNATVVSAFAVVALLLAAIGVYGVLSYFVSSRMREIGVRLALGADAPRVLRLVLGGGLRLALIGALVGIGAALAVTRLLQGLLVGVGASDPRMLVTAAVVMLAVACAAALLPARRASRVNPITVLKAE